MPPRLRSFPEDVTAAIQEPLQAKFHAYGARAPGEHRPTWSLLFVQKDRVSPSSHRPAEEDGSKKCIHVVGPDFREKDRPEMVAELQMALLELIASRSCS